VPRLETGAKSCSSCHNCLQGRFGLMADVYPSVRHPSDTCIACFRPALVFHPRRG
jgi:hypothetical protein